MTERGVVTKVKGNRATVQFDRKSACDSCHMCAVTRDGMKVQIVIENSLKANVGDFVLVRMGDRFVLTAALIVYIIPLVLVGIGVGAGSLLTELAQVLLALAGLVVGFAIAFLLDRFVIRKRKGFSPQMVEICCVPTVDTGASQPVGATGVTPADAAPSAPADDAQTIEENKSQNQGEQNER